ncbi:hypothetical protein [Lyngbya sp. CCY1209]|jgi:hypothetical protein|uniref:hypothetical protein n=1 Tax=Lyngbya sp. CCY1209 TaxID=2886103 RepID=UPI002D20E11A|nr:hypothetical protein [Lyngbya sp. CCY1209]MEB3883011.1 hypothetical protein [Lyngbya sp. CCY1209]
MRRLESGVTLKRLYLLPDKDFGDFKNAIAPSDRRGLKPNNGGFAGGEIFVDLGLTSARI